VSHRVIIADGLRAIAENPEVRQEMDVEQLQKIDRCLSEQEPCDEDMYRAQRILGRVYCSGD
jgi:hypothetical protein